MFSGLWIAGCDVENESGAKLAGPELYCLPSGRHPGDVLLIEPVDRLSRLTSNDWQKLRAELDAKQVRAVALDLPTLWGLATLVDEFTACMFAAVNGMMLDMLDMLAVVARKDYQDRRRHQAQGQARGRAADVYRDCREATQRNAGIAAMLKGGSSWMTAQQAFGRSRATVAKIAKRASSELGPVA